MPALKSPLPFSLSLADYLLALIFASLSILLFLNNVTGKFVQDDTYLIAQNPLIQDSRLYAKALSSDAFAFLPGQSGTATSSFWRPALTLYFIFGVRTFGLHSTLPWHITSLALYGLTCILTFIFLRRVRLSRTLASAVTLLFAVHPMHVEVVSYISVVGDLLLATSLLGSLLLVLSETHGKSIWKRIASLLLAAIALCSKESAIGLPVFVFLIILGVDDKSASTSSLKRAFQFSLPFIALDVLYLIIRARTLGGLAASAPPLAAFLQFADTVPAILFFYLHHTFWPANLSPTYPLRDLTPSTYSISNFYLPLIITIPLILLFIHFASANRIIRFALVWLVLIAAPAVVIGVAFPQSLIHDRYFFLPQLGLLIIVCLSLSLALQKLFRLSIARAESSILCLSIAASIPLAVSTLRYNPAWNDSLSLWSWAVNHQPLAAHARLNYADALRADGNPQAALAQLDRAFDISPSISLRFARARTLIDLHQLEPAAAELSDLIQLCRNRPFDLYRAYEALTVLYQQQSRLPEAQQTLRAAREHLPQLRCTLTGMLAVILHNSNRDDLAISELESVRHLVLQESTPQSRLVPFRLAQLYAAARRPADALAAYREFLDASAGFSDPEILSARAIAQQILSRVQSTTPQSP